METEDCHNLFVTTKSIIKSPLHYLNNQSMPPLPHAIIINILKRLPVKSLLRFQTVCKDWRNLIKTKSFINEHYLHSAHKNPLLICDSNTRNPMNAPICFLRYDDMGSVDIERMPILNSLRHKYGIIGLSRGLLLILSPPSLILLNPSQVMVMACILFLGWDLGLVT